MATILFTWELGGGAGHCVNLLPIAEQLIEQGHSIIFAARDVVTAKRVFQSLPVTFLQAPFLLERPSDAIQEPSNFAHILHNVGFGSLDYLQILTAAWRNIIRLVEPAIIVCEHSPTALFASRWTKVRRFVMGTGFFSPPDVSPLPDLRHGHANSDCGEITTSEQQILARLNQLLSADHLPELENVSTLYADVEASFLTTFRELDHYPERRTGEYYGSWSPIGGLHVDWPPCDGARIFAYLKHQSSVWRVEEVLSVLRSLGLPAIVYVPGKSIASFSQFRGKGLSFVTAPLDVNDVARQCDLAILNGNAGTSTALLLAGIPQLHIPLYFEQAVFSQRVVNLGAATAARPNRVDQTINRLSAMIDDSRFHARARAFRTHYASYDPRAAQSRIVERILLSLDNGT